MVLPLNFFLQEVNCGKALRLSQAAVMNTSFIDAMRHRLKVTHKKTEIRMLSGKEVFSHYLPKGS